MPDHMTVLNLNGYFLFAVTLSVIVGCSASHKEDGTRIFIDCMEQIQRNQLSSSDCHQKASEICSALSGELALSTRMRLVLAETKGIASDLARLAGIDFEPWNQSDCVAVHQDICHDFGPFFPCQYESCLNEIPQKCAKYEDQ